MNCSMCFEIDWSASNKKFNVVMHTYPHISMLIVSSHDTFAEAESAMNELTHCSKRELIAALKH